MTQVVYVQDPKLATLLAAVARLAGTTYAPKYLTDAWAAYSEGR